MTEITFMKNIKKWFWGSLLIQVVLGAVWIIYTNGAMSSTMMQNADDIRDIQIQLNNKAELSTVMRIKSDQDKVQQMILDNTKDLKAGQLQMINVLINHISKESK